MSRTSLSETWLCVISRGIAGKAEVQAGLFVLPRCVSGINLPLKSAPLIPLPGAVIFARVMARGFEDSEYACDGFGCSLSKASNLWVGKEVLG